MLSLKRNFGPYVLILISFPFWSLASEAARCGRVLRGSGGENAIFQRARVKDLTRTDVRKILQKLKSQDALLISSLYSSNSQISPSMAPYLRDSRGRLLSPAQLHRAVKIHYGSWEEGLKKIKVSPEKLVTPSLNREEVVQVLLALYNQGYLNGCEWN